MPDEKSDEGNTSEEIPEEIKKTDIDEKHIEVRSQSKSKIHGPSVFYGAVITAVVVLVITFGMDSTVFTEQEIIEESIIKNDNDKKITAKTFLENVSPILGNPNAPITLVEFGDYQCHFCNVYFENTEHEIIENFVDTGKVRILFKDFTIIGADSVSAAHTAHCAGEQEKFWEYHDVLYNNWNGENNGWASNDNLLIFANEIGLDINKLKECNADGRYKSVIEASNDDARLLGLTGTPAFFIISNNDVQKIIGAQPYEVFENIFETMLEK